MVVRTIMSTPRGVQDVVRLGALGSSVVPDLVRSPGFRHSGAAVSESVLRGLAGQEVVPDRGEVIGCGSRRKEHVASRSTWTSVVVRGAVVCLVAARGFGKLRRRSSAPLRASWTPLRGAA